MKTPKTGTELRREALREVEGCVCKDRQNTYGGAEDNFAAIARLWTVWLHVRGLMPPDKAVLSIDVAGMSGLIKTARAAHNPGHRDSWIDMAGYPICGAGIVALAEQEALAAADAVLADSIITTGGICKPTPEVEAIAPGHNTVGLTVAQVGAGWRLLTREEIGRREGTCDIQAWANGKWDDRPWSGSDLGTTYRTLMSPGYFLPKPGPATERLMATPLGDIAPGHNPDKLTIAQVGDGWRLLSADETRVYRAATDEIQCWEGARWSAAWWSGSDSGLTYRTQKPPGYFLPKPASYSEALREAVEPKGPQ